MIRQQAGEGRILVLRSLGDGAEVLVPGKGQEVYEGMAAGTAVRMLGT